MATPTAAPSLILRTCLHCGQDLATDQQDYCCQGCETLSNLIIPKNETDWDSAFIRSTYALDQNKTEYIFQSDGLHCSSCIFQIEELPQHLDDLKTMQVDFAKNQLHVHLLSEKSSLKTIVAALHDMGYPAQLLLPEEKNKSAEQHEKNLLKRLAVAGACAGNIMLFSISIYAGVQGYLKNIFNTLSFFIFLPILFYSAVPFYFHAFQSLRQKRLSIDLPIAIAVSIAFLFSVVQWLMGYDQIYFDSLAGFIFLILISRYLNWKVQSHYSKKNHWLSLFGTQNAYRLEDNNELKLISVHNINIQDQLWVGPGETVPADGYLVSSFAVVSSSFLTGESLPSHLQLNDKVFAGSKNQGAGFLIQVEAVADSTRLGQIFRQTESHLSQKNRILTKADLAAQYLIATVTFIAFVFFIIYISQGGSLNAAFQRSFALLIIACPCALAFGVPLAQKKSLNAARMHGWLVQSADAIENFAKADTIIFDKTGTLTLGELQLLPSALPVHEDIKSIVLSLEKESQHPVAHAFRKAWPIHPLALPKLHNLKDSRGGMQGSIDFDFYEIKKNDTRSEKYSVALFKNHIKIQDFYFDDQIREESAFLIQSLKKIFSQVLILSGDNSLQVEHVQKKLHLDANSVFSDLSPEDKMSIVKKYPRSIYIGDGHNDALAMNQASVSVALSHSPVFTQTQSDIFLTQSHLKNILDIFKISLNTQKLIRNTMVASFFYNALAGTAALAGWIGPLEAAVLMPISSLCILLTIRWSRLT
ncbi:MAG: heavy metal translocating P-type ATPase [Pseudobdellovibrionaceae bacterium]